MSQAQHCDDCGDVIGVYEPLVAIVDGHARELSRAADPHAAAHATQRFHRDCYERRNPATETGE
jgi:hypothetical protein